MIMDSPNMYVSMISKYTSVGALAVLIWDILDNIPEDYRVLFCGNKKRLTVATASYIGARVGALVYSLIGIIFLTAPVGNCAVLERAALAWCPLAVGASGFLFFLRLRAIYNRNRILIGVFFIFWLVLLAGGILVATGIKGGAVGSTMYCEDIWASKISLWGQLAPLSFDTLVFLAISWRLSRIGSYNNDGTIRSNSTDRIGTVLFGTNLPAFSRSLLVDGQIYYLITILIGIPSAAVFFSPGVPGALSDLLGDVYIVVVNIMACRVFRRTKSGTIRESEISTSMLNQQNTLPIQFRVNTCNSVDTVSKDEPMMVRAIQSLQ